MMGVETVEGTPYVPSTVTLFPYASANIALFIQIMKQMLIHITFFSSFYRFLPCMSCYFNQNLTY